MGEYTEFEEGRRRLPARLQKQKSLMRQTVEELRALAESKGINTTNLAKKELVKALSGDREE